MNIAGSGSPHVADAQVGEIRGYARLPPPPGWRKCPSLVICLCLAEMERFVVADSLPPPPGWRFLCASRRPGMSPTPRSAKYPATHGCHHLRGGGNVRLWSSSPPSAEMALCGASVIVSAVGGGAGALLRRGIISFIGPIGPMGPMGIVWCERCVSCAGERLCGVLGRTFGTHSYIYCTDPRSTA